MARKKNTTNETEGNEYSVQAAQEQETEQTENSQEEKGTEDAPEYDAAESTPELVSDEEPKDNEPAEGAASGDLNVYSDRQNDKNTKKSYEDKRSEVMEGFGKALEGDPENRDWLDIKRSGGSFTVGKYKVQSYETYNSEADKWDQSYFLNGRIKLEDGEASKVEDYIDRGVKASEERELDAILASK